MYLSHTTLIYWNTKIFRQPMSNVCVFLTKCTLAMVKAREKVEVALVVTKVVVAIVGQTLGSLYLNFSMLLCLTLPYAAMLKFPDCCGNWPRRLACAMRAFWTIATPNQIGRRQKQFQNIQNCLGPLHAPFGVSFIFSSCTLWMTTSTENDLDGGRQH